ncbi:unnamed protein product [Toxocara canis]|uniref:dCTP deaminase n=1 Tax=Toxocara canis TaxID=6265 RepID=A0A183U3H2_TOXCA|nr:unnamed protein product [Toxocara canis]
MNILMEDRSTERTLVEAHKGEALKLRIMEAETMHRSGTYVRPDERFAPFSAGDTIGRYSTEATAVPATSSRYEVNREREHGRHG